MQIDQAAKFVEGNIHRLNMVLDKLVQSGKILFESACKEVLPEDILSIIEKALEKKDVHVVFNCIRPQAAKLRRHDRHCIYWEWIDAYGLYSDAIGNQWKYMTEEKRQRSMQWAEELMNSIAA